MSKIEFIKEPGYTYDLLRIFSVYFNKQYFKKEPLGYQNGPDDCEFYEQMLESYLPITDDLLPFFYINENNMSFMTHYYFVHYNEYFLTGDYNVSFIQEALSDSNEVVNNLYRFYFRDISDELIEECKTSSLSLNKLIRNSNYNSDLRSSLYSFFLEPMTITQKLSYELMAKSFILSQEYENHYKDLVEAQKLFTDESIIERLQSYKEQSINFENFEKIYISIGMHIRQTILLDYFPDSLLIITGPDFYKYTDYLINQGSASNLDIFGDVMSESNRVKILQFVRQRRTVTLKEIETELNLTATNSYYHLALMVKTGMLKTKNKGRTILYSINNDYFYGVIDTIKKFIVQEEN